MDQGGGGNSLFEAILSGIDVSKKLGEKSPGFPRQIAVLFDMVEEALSIKTPFTIRAHPRNYQAKAFIGAVEVFGDHADIYYDRDRNHCWRRFIVTKELCHLLFADSGEQHLASTEEEVEQLISQLLVGLHTIDFDQNPRVGTEFSTIIMAIEILMPDSERSTVREMITEGRTELEIAKKYMIPQQFVGFYLTSPYESLYAKAYRLADTGRSEPTKLLGP